MSWIDDTDRSPDDASYNPGDGDSSRERLRDYWRQCIRSAWKVLQTSKADGRRMSQANLIRLVERSWQAALREMTEGVDESDAIHLRQRGLEIAVKW